MSKLVGEYFFGIGKETFNLCRVLVVSKENSEFVIYML
jgi:hypothetical protein